MCSISKERMYIRGKYDVSVPAHLNFGKYMLDQIRKMGDKIALKNGETGEKITFKEIEEYAVKLAVALSKLGVQRGDIVALASEKRLMFIPTLIGIALSGAIYSAFDFNSGRAHLHHKMSITRPKFCIVSQTFWDTNQKSLENFDFVEAFLTLDDPIGSILSVKSLIMSCNSIDVASFEPPEVQGQVDTALILYSSGTTGMPKALKISHLSVILDIMPYGFDDKSITVAYLEGYWHHNLDSYLTYKMWACGAKVVYTTQTTTDVLITTFENEQVNIIICVPYLANLLSKTKPKPNENLECLKYIYIAASSIRVKVLENLKKSRFPSLQLILQSYGMSELGGAITCENWSQKGPKLGSVGSVFPCISIKVEDPNTRELLGPNQPGEICVKGPKLMLGYVGTELTTILDADGFFRTGDLGYYDEEGYFYIVDRLKEIINYSGYKIAPVELETILLLHPEVKEAGVTGKKVPIVEEEPVAFVVRQPGSTVTEQELIDFVAAEVPDYMQLKGGIKFVTEIPKNPRGKILRRRLQEMLNGA